MTLIGGRRWLADMSAVVIAAGGCDVRSCAALWIADARLTLELTAATAPEALLLPPLLLLPVLAVLVVLAEPVETVVCGMVRVAETCTLAAEKLSVRWQSGSKHESVFLNDVARPSLWSSLRSLTLPAKVTPTLMTVAWT